MVKTLKTLAATRLAVPLVCLLALTLLAPLTYASVLSTGSSAPPSPLFPTGTLVISTAGTITTPTFSANYTEQVLSDPFNTWCANCLDFVYTFTNLGGDALGRFSMYSFGGVSVDAGTDPFGIKDPTTLDRSPDGKSVAFNFPGGDAILAGVTTVKLVIETDARKYTTGFVSAQDGTAGFGFAYAPMAATPEPASLALLGGGLTLVGGLLRRKSR